jgi:hypothetical protein
MSQGRDSERMAKRQSLPKARQYQTGLVQERKIKPRRATYGDGIAI